MTREDSSLIGAAAALRQPKSQSNAKEADDLSVVATEIATRVREEEIEKAILEKQGLKVKVIRHINRASERGIPKVKVTSEKKEEMGEATKNNRLFIAELKSTRRKRKFFSATGASDSATLRTPADHKM